MQICAALQYKCRKHGGIHLIVSMTGYGRAEMTLPEHKLLVEMRAVNHRFAEVIVRMPREWMGMEERVRKLVGSVVARGRVEVFISVPTLSHVDSSAIEVDRELLSRALKLIREVSVGSEVDFEPPSIGALLAIPGLFRQKEQEIDASAIEEALFETVGTALLQLQHAREVEGKHVTEHVSTRLRELLRTVLHMQKRAPELVDGLRDKLTFRLQQLLLSDVAPERIALEVAIAAEKTSVEEETERLKSHVEQFLKLMHSEERAVGRRLDFLLQEMNREVNTIGSKCSDLEMTDAVLLSKHGIEQMREQVQNIE
ncbi:hypothetical protein MM817_02472 [Acidibacillus sp. S0AB]|uniref:YicC family protein n=2 Tax=Sulfoacidibacillus ferrooxidans TaxID=2005001 RepID=A0A9X1VDP9_9BACL|nr:hypothetical protein [Sulfoacidibacillus ferrooxidans]